MLKFATKIPRPRLKSDTLSTRLRIRNLQWVTSTKVIESTAIIHRQSNCVNSHNRKRRNFVFSPKKTGVLRDDRQCTSAKFSRLSRDSGPISERIQVRLPTRRASGAFLRTRTVAPSISPSSIFASWSRRPAFSRYPSVSGRADGDGDALHDTDRRSPHRVARTRRGIPRFVREASGLEPLSSSIRREESSPLPPPPPLILRECSVVGKNKATRGPTLAARSRVATTCCFRIRPTTARPFRRARRGRTAECPCGGADLSRIPKDDARASRQMVDETVLKNWSLTKRVVVPCQNNVLNNIFISADNFREYVSIISRMNLDENSI